MKRYLFGALVLGLSILALDANEAPAEVNININIGAPPALSISNPPDVILIPGTYVYFAADIGVDILFYGGYWYRPHAGRWYRASDYNGPWVFIEAGKMPRALMNLPPGFRRTPPGHERIPHGHLLKNWKQWEKERHWERHRLKREMKKEIREERKEHRKGKGKPW